MKTRRIVLIAVLAQLLALTTFAQKILIDSDKSANFSKFKTYAWQAGTPAQNPLMNDRIIAAIDMQMANKGLVKVDAEKMPDLIVVYHAAVQYETQLSTINSGWYYGGTATTYVDKVPAGNLRV